MRNKLGDLFMALGLGLMVCALGLFLSNQQEASQAGTLSMEVVQQLAVKAHAAQEPSKEMAESGAAEAAIPDPYDPHMTEVEINGELYIGFLSIPKLELELPVMSSWSYSQLKTAPCRYYGSAKTNDLVVMAHNYAKHFGKLNKLAPGDSVVFTDMDGIITPYQVAELNVLDPNAVAEMTAGEYDLTLFTCTYGGENRITLRCSRR